MNPDVNKIFNKFKEDKVKDAYNTLSKAYSNLNRIVITATNI